LLKNAAMSASLNDKKIEAGGKHTAATKTSFSTLPRRWRSCGREEALWIVENPKACLGQRDGFAGF
jgi:hypothetical protein